VDQERRQPHPQALHEEGLLTAVGQRPIVKAHNTTIINNFTGWTCPIRPKTHQNEKLTNILLLTTEVLTQQAEIIIITVNIYNLINQIKILRILWINF